MYKIGSQQISLAFNITATILLNQDSSSYNINTTTKLDTLNHAQLKYKSKVIAACINPAVKIHLL